MANGSENQDPGERPFRSVMDAMSLGMAFQVHVSPDRTQRRFTWVSESCEALNGVPAEAVLQDASRLYDLIHPDHRRRFAEAEEIALAAMAPFHIEAPFRLPDGRERWSHVTSAPRRLADGSTQWDGVQIDITERVQAEAEVRAARRRLELAVEATDLGFWELEPESGRLAWSDRNRAIFGVGPEEPVDASRFREMVHPEDRDGLFKTYREAIETGCDIKVEYRICRPDGAVRWVRSQGRVAEGPPAERLVVGTTLDVTDRRLSEEQAGLVARELAHRAKNGFAVVLAIVAQSARNAGSAAELERLLTERLTAMSRSQDLITEADGRPPLLAELLNRSLAPFDLSRFDIDAACTGVRLSSEAALALALLLHEFATNATKYGALSVPGGRVELARIAAKPGMARLRWRELGGPRVAPSNNQGFGARLIQLALRAQGGCVEAEFAPEGVTLEFEFPRRP